jgi:hypothetical protein
VVGVADRDIPVSTGDENVPSGANGQTIPDEGWTKVKKSYARATKRGAQAADGGASKKTSKLTGLGRVKSEQAHSIQ